MLMCSRCNVYHADCFNLVSMLALISATHKDDGDGVHFTGSCKCYQLKVWPDDGTRGKIKGSLKLL